MYIYDSKYNTRRLLQQEAAHQNSISQSRERIFADGPTSAPPSTSSVSTPNPNTQNQGSTQGIDGGNNTTNNQPPTEPPESTKPMDEPKIKGDPCKEFRKLKSIIELKQSITDQAETFINQLKGSCRPDRNGAITRVNSFAQPLLNQLENPDKGLCAEYLNNDSGNYRTNFHTKIHIGLQNFRASVEEVLDEKVCCTFDSLGESEERFRQQLELSWNSFRHSWSIFINSQRESFTPDVTTKLRRELSNVKKEFFKKASNLKNFEPPKGDFCPNTQEEFQIGFMSEVVNQLQLLEVNLRKILISVPNGDELFDLRTRSPERVRTVLRRHLQGRSWSNSLVTIIQNPSFQEVQLKSAIDEMETENNLELNNQQRGQVERQARRTNVDVPPPIREKVGDFLLDATGRSLGDNPTDEEIEKALQDNLPGALDNAREEFAKFIKAVFKSRIKKIMGNRSRESRKAFGINTSLVQAIRQLSVREIVMARTGQLR